MVLKLGVVGRIRLLRYGGIRMIEYIPCSHYYGNVEIVAVVNLVQLEGKV